MPELPEVETVKKEVLPYVKGRTILGLETPDGRNIKGISIALFKKKVIGQKIMGIERRAKYMLFRFRSSNYMTVHLGMTGRLLFQPDKYVKIIFYLSGRKKIYFSDARLFGKIRFFDKYPDLKLGPEPLSKELTFEKFKALIKSRKTSIKLILLDQKLISGIGNIYANEALFMAGIDPRRKANRLSDIELKKLYNAINSVLARAIKNRGTSDNWFVDAKGKKGNFQNLLKVYNRKGERCPKCKGAIQRIGMGQRGTYFCPSCQK